MDENDIVKIDYNATVIIVAGRGFGDAIMVDYTIEKIKKIRNDLVIDVLCENCLNDVFAYNTLIHEIYTAKLCISRRTWRVGDLIRKISFLHKKYDVGIEIIGDFRERILLKMLAPKCVYGLVREKGNLYKGFYNYGKSLVYPVKIPNSIFNIYDSIDYFVGKILGENIVEYNNEYRCGEISNSKKMVLGIHPFSGLSCKMWEWRKWNSLVDYFYRKNIKIKVFCAANEIDIVRHYLIVKDNMEIVSGTIRDFKNNLRKVSCLICLDSFSMHMAYMLGIPNVMLNGANDYRLWQTRLTHTVSTGNATCIRWPCWGGHGCKDYKCIKNIEVNDVIQAVNNFMRYENDEKEI